MAVRVCAQEPKRRCGAEESYADVCHMCLLDRFEALCLKHFHFQDMATLLKFKKASFGGPHDEKSGNGFCQDPLTESRRCQDKGYVTIFNSL